MTSDEMSLDKKKGYLEEDFLFFHLKDSRYFDFQFHYHDFHKLVIFLSGDVTYLIEGKFYKLRPWDMLFVSNTDFHKAIISSHLMYERIILWIKPSFVEKYTHETCNLLTCFEEASKLRNSLLRLDSSSQKILKPILTKLEKASKDTGFGSDILKNASFLELIVWLNRLFLNSEEKENLVDIAYDTRIQQVLDYINADLKKNLSIEHLSNQFFLNKYYLMHLFKEQTGYSIHQYIQKKRLLLASLLLKEGKQATEVCSSCGFGDYSSFIRAFKKEFGHSPKKYYESSL
ncbi:MAG: hypothetical protein K0S30_704 [Clostridia bacterium]|jgi:AraC-like DNA-binding protein|nr:hypothetical protein [Clostridia bacterium]